MVSEQKIRIPDDVKRQLDDLREYPGECYGNVIARLIPLGVKDKAEREAREQAEYEADFAVVEPVGFEEYRLSERLITEPEEEAIAIAPLSQDKQKIE